MLALLMKKFFIKGNDLWPILFLGLGGFGYLLRVTNCFSDIPGDLGDARFNSVILEHILKWLTGYESSLWGPRFFYPFENVLAFSDNHFGSSVFYILFRLLGFSRETAYNCWFIVGNILSFFAAFYCLQRLNFSNFSSAVGAFVFAFGLPVLAKEGHAQLIYRFATPLSFYCFIKYIETNQFKLLSWCAFWIMFQTYCSIYLGMFLAYLLLAVAISAFSIKQSFDFNKLLINLTNEKSFFNGSSFLILFCVGAITWLLYQYYLVSIDYGFKRVPFEIASMLPRLSSYLISDRVSISAWAGQWVTDIPMRHEHQLFFGFGVWVLIFYGSISVWKGCIQINLGKVSLLAFIILFTLTIHVNGYSLYLILAKLPGISAIRAVSRIVLIMLMPISVLVAIGTENIIRLTQNRSRFYVFNAFFIVTLLLSVEVIAYQPYKTPANLWVSRQETLRSMLPMPLNRDSILFVTKKEPEPPLFAELDGMILAQDLGIPTLNGYSGNIPPGYLEPLPCYSYQNRFMAYAVHRQLQEHEFKKKYGKLVIISPSPCKYEPVLALQADVTTEQAKNLILKINDVKTIGDRIQVKILARNSALVSLNTVSMAGRPVRLSWRFIPLTPSGEPMSDIGWDTRKDLLWTIAPNNSKETTVLADLPTKPGNYLLEFSLVQEGVAWFQDLGMRIPSYQITVNGP